MISFKKYLSHRIKSTFILTAVLCLFAIILIATTLKVRQYSYYVDIFDELGYPTGAQELREGVSVRNLGIIFVILGALCTVVPVLELSGLKNKRNADTIYSLPIDRRKLGAAHFANGFLQILAVYLCAAVTAALMIIPRGLGFLHLQYLPLLLLLPIPASLLLYAYFCFLFNEANSTADGCVFIASGILTPFIFCLTMDTYDLHVNGKYVQSIFNKMNSAHPLPYFNLWKISDVFGDGLNHRNLSFSYDNLDITMIVVWCIIGLLATIGFYLAFSRKRTEKIGDISSSFAGYRAFIPLGMFCISAYSFQNGEIVLCIVGAIAAIIGYMIYRRSIRIRTSDFICIGASIAVAILLHIAEEAMMTGRGI